MGVNPLVSVAVAISLAAAGLIGKSASLINVKQHIVCSSELVQLDEPAADILFVGSSRTGRAIDPVYIQDQLNNGSDNALSVERLSPTSARVPRFNVLIQDYVKNRGAPKIVVLQLVYSRFGTTGPTEMRFLNRVPFTASPETMAEVVKRDLRANGVPAGLEAFHRDGTTSTRLTLARAAAYIYGTIRAPVRIALSEKSVCPPERIRKQMPPPYWPYDSVTNTTGPVTKSPYEIKTREVFARNAPSWPAEDPELAERQFETEQMAEIVRFLTENGTRVLLTTIPKYKQSSIPDEFVDDYESLIGADFYNPYVGLSETELIEINESSLDGVHVDTHGAAIYSNWWAKNLKAELQ